MSYIDFKRVMPPPYRYFSWPVFAFRLNKTHSIHHGRRFTDHTDNEHKLVTLMNVDANLERISSSLHICTGIRSNIK